jgi:hypothetical protein
MATMAGVQRGLVVAIETGLVAPGEGRLLATEADTYKA